MAQKRKATVSATHNEIEMLKDFGLAYPISLVRTMKIGKPNKHLQIRTAPDGRKYEWHPTKGFRRWIS